MSSVTTNIAHKLPFKITKMSSPGKKNLFLLLLMGNVPLVIKTTKSQIHKKLR